MARPYSVLSVVPPRARKAKPESSTPPPVIRGWRVRYVALSASEYCSEDEARRLADEHPERRPVVECLIGSVYGAPPRDVPTVADLAHEGMAHPTEDGKAWKITPLGQAVLTDAMRGLDE